MADNVGAAGFSTIPVKLNVIVISLGSLTQRVLAASLKDAHVIALTDKGPTADALASKFAGDNLILFNIEINKQTYDELHKKFHRIFVIVPPGVASMPRCDENVLLIEYSAMNKMHFQLRGGLLPFIMLWESAIIIQFGDRCIEFVANCTKESSLRLFKSIEVDLVRRVSEVFACGSRAIEKIDEHITRGEMLYQHEIDVAKSYIKTGKMITLTFETPSLADEPSAEPASEPANQTTSETSEETNESASETNEPANEPASESEHESASSEAVVALSTTVGVKLLVLYDNVIDEAIVSLENIAKLSQADLILLYSANFFRTGEQSCAITSMKPLTSVGAEYVKHKDRNAIMSDITDYFREKKEEEKRIAIVEA